MKKKPAPKTKAHAVLHFTKEARETIRVYDCLEEATENYRQEWRREAGGRDFYAEKLGMGKGRVGAILRDLAAQGLARYDAARNVWLATYKEPTYFALGARNKVVMRAEGKGARRA